MAAPELLLIPEEAWRVTAILFEQFAATSVEAGMYWYGIRTPDVALACVAGIPRQSNLWGSFNVDADDLASLTRRIRQPLVVVAQLHTHPGIDVEHSSFDDERAVSRKIFSLVLPRYGVNANLENVGVHEFQEDRRSCLSQSEATRRVIIAPLVVDMRHDW